MQIARESISLKELENMAKKMYGNLVKAVVDIDQNIMAVDAELHADQENALLEEHGSQQNNLWGINLYPSRFGNQNWIEFDSMINLRPSWGNSTRGVDDPLIQEKIRAIVARLVKP